MVKRISKSSTLEAQLHEITESYERVLENSNEAIFRVNGSDNRILSVNAAAERILGYGADEWTSDPSLAFRIVHSDYATVLRDLLEELRLKREIIRNAELAWISKDSHTVFLSCTLIPVLDKQRHLVSFEVICRDITERRQTERALREANVVLSQKNEELKRQANLKTQFVANVSHEFRNPLTIVKATIDTLLDRTAGDLSPKQDEMLTRAKNTVDRLIRLVTDLLDLSRIEAGKLELNRRQIDVAPFVADLLDHYEDELTKKGLTLTRSIRPNAGLLWGDQDRLTEILLNLLDNARKYTPSGGKVTVTADGNAHVVRLEVADTGPGIPEYSLDRIFDKYERLVTERQEGTGLGLPIAKDLVELHRGHLFVESSEGNGSRFIVELPRDLRREGVMRPSSRESR